MIRKIADAQKVAEEEDEANTNIEKKGAAPTPADVCSVILAVVSTACFVPFGTSAGHCLQPNTPIVAEYL